MGGILMRPAPRRAPYQIVLEIMGWADQGTAKTKLMHMCNLDTAHANQYLSAMIEKGLISLSDSRYFLTEYGESRYRSLQDAAKVIEEVIA
jgi:predicted transcriptional regulator